MVPIGPIGIISLEHIAPIGQMEQIAPIGINSLVDMAQDLCHPLLLVCYRYQ